MKSFNEFTNDNLQERPIHFIKGLFKSPEQVDVRGWKIRVHQGRHPDVPDISSRGNILFAIDPETGDEHHIASGNLSDKDIKKFIRVYGLDEKYDWEKETGWLKSYGGEGSGGAETKFEYVKGIRLIIDWVDNKRRKWVTMIPPSQHKPAKNKKKAGEYLNDFIKDKMAEGGHIKKVRYEKE
tara:strand:- start:7942 stop:8487 length:546 start_codon:yes stop_codon:yes gene_type:complete